MCGSRHTFSRTETKYFVGATEIPANQLREIPGYRFAELFPHRRDGFTLKYGVKPVQIPDRDRIPVAQQKEDHLATLGHWKHRRVERGEMTEAQYAAEMAAAEKNWFPSSAFAYLVTNATPPQAIDRVIKWERKEKQTMCGAKCRNARGPNCDCICEGKYHGAGMTNSRTRFAASDLDFKPTAEMAANAARGLELREKHGKGGTAVGVARARDIKNRANLSPDTVKRMHSFFSRHEGNQAGGEDDAGYIAWLLWGGDAGKAWAARKAAQIDKSESARFALPKVDLEYVRGVGEDYGRRAAKRGINRLIDDHEAYSRLKLLKYALDPMSPMRDKIDRAFDAGWLRGLTSVKISDVEHPPKFKVGDRVVHDIGTSKHIGKVVRVLAYTEPEPQYLVEFTTLPTGTPRRNISESSLHKSEHTRSRFTKAAQIDKSESARFDRQTELKKAKQVVSDASQTIERLKDKLKRQRALDIDGDVSSSTQKTEETLDLLLTQYRAVAALVNGNAAWHEVATAVEKLRSTLKVYKSESARGAARKATMARELVGSKGNKRIYLGGPDGSGKYNLYFVQVANTGVPGESPAEDLIELKQFATEARARSAAQKMLSSRPGAKARFEQLQVGDAFRFEGKIYVVNSNAAEVNALLASDKRDSEKAMMLAGYLYKRWLSYEGRANASRPGAKAKFDRMAVANEILRQLGGGRFMAMVGGKNALATTVNGKNGLQVQIGRGAKNGINRLVVLLDEGSDTYDMQLWRIGQRGLSTTKVWEGDGLYAEDLARIFTDKTGFYTSFARPGKSSFSLAAVKSAAAKVAAAYGTGEDSAVIRKHLDRIVSVLSGNTEGGRREAMGIHAQIGSIAERTHGRDFMWSAPMQGLESAIRSAGQFARPGAKARFAGIRDSLVAELRAFTAHSLNAPRQNPDWYGPANTWLSRKKAQAAHDYAISGDHAKSNELVKEASKAFDIVEQEFWTARKAQPFSRPGAKAKFYTSPTKTGKNGPVTWDNLFVGHLGNGWTLANKGHEVSGDYERVAHIAYGGEVTFAPGFNQARLDPRVKAYIQKLSVEAAQKKSAGDPLARTGSGQGLYSRARFANWETNLTKKYGKPIEEHTAKIGRNSWKIEVAEAMDGSVVANLFLWNDNRGFEHFESGSLQGLRSLAERISRSDAAGIAKINRIANYSRPGAKANGLTLAQRIAVAHDAKRMALR